MKYLIVGPSWVGDMIMAQTLFITLKQKKPDAMIDVLAPQWSNPILERMPEVRRCIDMPLNHGRLDLGIRKSIAAILCKEGYDQAIVLPNSFKSALIPFWAKIPVRTGWRGEMRFGLINDIRTLNKKQYPLMAQRFISLGYPKQESLPELLPKPKLEVSALYIDNALSRHDLNTDTPILALCPGAEFGTSKQWPSNYYSEIALNMIESGWQVWLFGSEKDHSITNEIVSYIPDLYQEKCCNLAGKTTLSEAVDLLSQASAVVSNDSGLMHITAALSRPLVAIYGSTTAAHTPPMNHHSKTLWLGLKCSPCFKRECPLEHHDCMKLISPTIVMNALKELQDEEAIAISKSAFRL